MLAYERRSKTAEVTKDEVMDNETTIGELRTRVTEFVSERDWEQFHAPKNLSMALAIEAAELMEHFQWITAEESRDRSNADRMSGVRDEIADVLCYVLAIANELDIDLSEAFTQKMVKNVAKYPAAEFRGRYGPEDSGPNESGHTDQ